MARTSPDPCMFCDAGDCPTHSAPKKLKVTKKLKTVQLPEQNQSQAVLAMQADTAQADLDEQEMIRAIRILAPIISLGDLRRNVEMIGVDLVNQITKERVAKWKLERGTHAG